MNYNKLNSEEERVIVDKATEPPFIGEYDNFYKDGIYICRRCNMPLFSSKSKFNSRCGWPSFDEYYPNAIRHVPDSDGIRIKIEENVSTHYLYVLSQRTRSCQRK